MESQQNMPPLARRATPDAFGNGDGNGDATPRRPHALPDQQHAAGGHDPHALEEIPKDLPKIGTGSMLVVGLSILAVLVGFFFLGYLPRRERIKQAESDKSERVDTRPAVGIDHPL